jgi:hypothetical protein
MARRLLMLDSNGMQVWREASGRLLAEAFFPPDPDGHQGFTGYLERSRHHVFRLLVDLPDEQHSNERIPTLRGQERQALCQRRLAQHFPQARLRMSSSLGDEMPARQHERLLLSAIPESAALTPWLDCLQAQSTKLAGIHSSAQLAPVVVATHPASAGAVILLSQHAQTIRASFVVAGKLHYSRSTRRHDHLQADSAIDIAAELADSAERLHRHLINQRQIDAQAPLPVLVIAPAAIDEIHRHGAGNPQLDFQRLDTGVAAKNPAVTDASALFLHLFTSRPLAAQFADTTLRRPFQLFQFGRRCLATGMLSLLLALPVAVNQWVAAKTRDSESMLLNESREALARKSVHAPALPAGLDLPGLRQLTDDHTRLHQARTDTHLISLLRDLSQVLEPFPAINLNSIDWRREGDAQAANLEFAFASARESSPQFRVRQLENFMATLAGLSDWQIAPASSELAAATSTFSIKLDRKRP